MPDTSQTPSRSLKAVPEELAIHVICTAGPDQGKSFTAAGTELIVGQIQTGLTDPGVSGRHVIFWWSGKFGSISGSAS